MFTLIGDIVGSRTLWDRTAAQRAVNAAVDRVSTQVDVQQQIEPTVGDEVQGGFATFGAATLATLLINLELSPDIKLRFGLGNGQVTVHDGDRRPLLQDGPGWWTAREAIGHLKGRHGTWYVGPPDGSPDPALLNAFLLARDALVARLSDRQHRMLLLSLQGRSQREIAAVESITESAVSQAFARGVRGALDAQRLLAHPDNFP